MCLSELVQSVTMWYLTWDLQRASAVEEALSSLEKITGMGDSKQSDNLYYGYQILYLAAPSACHGPHTK